MAFIIAADKYNMNLYYSLTPLTICPVALIPLHHISVCYWQGSSGFPGFPGANGEKGARVREPTYWTVVCENHHSIMCLHERELIHIIKASVRWYEQKQQGKEGWGEKKTNGNSPEDWKRHAVPQFFTFWNIVQGTGFTLIIQRCTEHLNT